MPDETPPGPDDVVTVTVGGKGKHGRVETEIERGAGAAKHPDGSRLGKSRRSVPDVEMPSL